MGFMLEFLPTVFIVLNALALSFMAVRNYRNSGTLELMKSFNSYFISYIFTWLLVFFLVIVMPTSAKVDGGLAGLAQGNSNLAAYGSGLLFCPAFIPALLVLAYIFTRVPGNEGKLSYALFALLVLQQILYATGAADPHKAMIWLGILYTVGFVAVFAGAALAGGLLARAFPETERRHEEWARAMLADPDFGAKDAEARTIKMNVQASAQPASTAGPGNTRIEYGPRTGPVFTWKPSQVAAALLCFSIWNILIYIAPVLI